MEGQRAGDNIREVAGEGWGWLARFARDISSCSGVCPTCNMALFVLNCDGLVNPE